MEVIVFDASDNRWLSFSSPMHLLHARSLDDVESVVAQAEYYQQQGCYVVGFVSYEAAPAFDRALSTYEHPEVPLAMFGVFGQPSAGSLDAADCPAPVVRPDISREMYDYAISRIKSYLRGGDTYQVNYTHFLVCKINSNVRDLFARLARAQHADHAMYIETEEFAVCSVSPELFFEREGDRITTEPMKGTRPRGRCTEEDLQLKNDLRQSEKDRAENLMIVDMLRNDLGRIAEPGSVRVERLFEIRQLPTVWQQISKVSAESNASLVEVFGALFPCASVTGAPKRRTMEIIKELEVSPRGIYTGAIGMLKPDGRTRFNVAIRTLTFDKTTNSGQYGVGGGIVWDSSVEEEWQEALTKAKVLQYHQPEFRLLETMLYEPGLGIFLLDYHVDRLRKSASYFDFDIPQDLIGALQNYCGKGKERVRLLISHDGRFVFESTELVDSHQPVRLRISPRKVSSTDRFLFHKTTYRINYELALETMDDCDDVILVNERGELTETTICNLYLKLDGELLTPALSSGLLPGTYRQMMLDKKLAREAVLKPEDLEHAESIFVSNAVRKLNEAVVVG